MSHVFIGLIVLFSLGVSNFVLHAAVLDSGHPLVEHMPDSLRALGGRVSLIAEFLILLAAMLLVANGWGAIVWAYGGYSVLNWISAWMILTHRV